MMLRPWGIAGFAARSTLLLDGGGRLQLIGLVSAIFLGSLLDMLGIGLFLPFLQLTMNPNPETGSFLARVSAQVVQAVLPSRDPALLAGSLFLFYAAKNGLLAWIVDLQARFIYTQQVHASRRLLANYLARPWEYHLGRNSAELVRNVTITTATVFAGALLPLVRLIMESLLVGVSIILLMVIEPVGTLITAGVLGGVLGGFYVLVRRRVGVWGHQREALVAERIKWVNQALGAIRDVKLLGVSLYFENAFSQAAKADAVIAARLNMINQMPRLFGEVAVLGTLLIVVGLIGARGQDMADTVAVLGVFAAAAFRILPSMNRIVTYAADIRQRLPACQEIFPDLIAQPRAEDLATLPPFERELKLDGVTYAYPNTSEPAISGLSLTIRKGDSVALVGMSGAGKSTVADLILGLLTPQEGVITVDGRPLADPASWSRHMGYVPQSIYLLDDTIRRNIALGIPDHQVDEERLQDAIRAAQLDEVIANQPAGQDTMVGERGVRLSGGQRQRIGIARALYHRPSILVLDEATSALDGDTERQVAEMLQRLRNRLTMVIIAHRMATVKACDHLFLLDKGRLVAEGSFARLYAEEERFRRLAQAPEYGLSNGGM